MNLVRLGWSNYFNQFVSIEDKVARITSVDRGLYTAMGGSGDVYLIPMRSEFSATIGDFVVMDEVYHDGKGRLCGRLTKVIPRKTHISRIKPGTQSELQCMAANVDRVFVVTSANDDFSVNRLHRYIVLARVGGAEAVVVLNKTDLQDNHSKLVDQIQTSLPDVLIVAHSALLEGDCEKVKALLTPSSTSVFVGSSGVGKSTLVNRLLGKDVQKTLDIRESDGKGMHTTTSRQMFFTEGGGIIIDTPGLREIQVFGGDTSLNDTFASISEFSKLCQFNNCQHSNEPGCAVLSAIEAGKLSPDDLESQRKLEREMDYANRKLDKRTASNQKRKWKSIDKQMKERDKIERKAGKFKR